MIDDKSFREGYSIALKAFKKSKMQISDYTNDDAKDSSMAYQKLIEKSI